MRSTIALASLVLLLCLVNHSIWKKEQHLDQGRIVLLELAPVDPRSLMQGDYMALDFKVGNEIVRALPKLKGHTRWRPQVEAPDGYAVVALDNKGVATFKRIYSKGKIGANEMLLHYRVRNRGIKFATNAFFFEEGTAKAYEQARYGQFRVSEDGEMLLVAMRDENLKQIAAPNN